MEVPYRKIRHFIKELKTLPAKTVVAISAKVHFHTGMNAQTVCIINDMLQATVRFISIHSKY